jgi:hypothetical protein
MVKRGASTISQIQVKWQLREAGLITWEEVFDLRRRFPNHTAWGQAAFQGRGTVRAKAKAFRVRRRATVGRLAIEERNSG